AEELDELWKGTNPAELRHELAQQHKAEKEPWQRQLLLFRWHASLLRTVARSPAPDFEKARQVLKAIEDLDGVRPTATHFLALLRRDVLPARRGDKQLGEALQLRQQAERAALGLRDEEDPDDKLPAYSAQVAAWLGKEIDAADQERRLGEDLLFASQVEDW